MELFLNFIIFIFLVPIVVIAFVILVLIAITAVDIMCFTITSFYNRFINHRSNSKEDYNGRNN